MNILSPHSVESRRRAVHKTGLLTVADIGSSKISCLIARLIPLQNTQHLPWRTHRIEVLGFAMRQSQGVRSGLVVDIAAAEQAVRNAVDAAERMAGLVVKSVIVNFSGRHMRSEQLEAEIALSGARAELADVRRVIKAACGRRQSLPRPIIHAVPLSFSLDDDRNLEDPRDMAGALLGVDMHCLSIDALAARNLEHCLNRAYLKVEALAATPYAAALSTLLREEIQFGAVCADFGAGTTSFAIFHKGKFIHAGCIPLGGRHITADIAQGFSISVEEAEKLKVMHGSAADYECGDDQYVSLGGISGAGRRFSRKELAKIIRARVEEIGEMLRDRSNRAGFRFGAGRRLVLTGGGAQLAGLPDIIRKICLVKPRIGRPLGIAGLPASARGGAYAALAGLAVYPQSLGFSEQEFNPAGTEYEPGGKLKNAGSRFLQSVNGYVKVFKGF